MLKFHREILEEFKSIGKNGKVIAFGSLIRGNYRLDSDIDLAIITNNFKTRKKATEIADKILIQYGKLVSLKFFTTEEFEKRKGEREPLVSEVMKGKVIYDQGEH
jgi:predicted nucleotidyltransferase